MFLGLALISGGLQAQTLGLVKFLGADLRSEPNLQASVLTNIPAGERTVYLSSQGPFWWKVRWKDQEGWLLRALVEKLTPEEIMERQAEAGHSEADRTRTAAKAPLPAGQGKALVFGLSNYAKASGISSLPGVPVDMVSASSMAQMMGISSDQISVLRDQQVTREGLIGALKQLASEVKPDQTVLVYYSGHGGRVDDPSQSGRCIEGLITHEGTLLTSKEMADLLRPIAQTTDNLFVFIDACHSGGLSGTRSVADEILRPKFVSKSTGSNCQEIVNMLKESETGTRAAGSRFVYAGAARPDEISLDDARTGGLATSNWLKCMASHDNKQTIENLRECTQRAIDERMRGNSLFKPQHLTLTGDLSIQPMRANLDIPIKLDLLANSTAIPPSAPTESSKSAEVLTQLGKKGITPPKSLDQAIDSVIKRSASPLSLKVETSPVLKIDSGVLRGSVLAPTNGFLYVFYVPTEGKSLNLLFPNLVDRDNRLFKGKAFQFPRPDWPLIAGGPEGSSRLVFIFSRHERDLAQLVGGVSAPFFEVGLSPLGVQSFNLAMSRTAYEMDESCRSGERRQKPDWCDPTYIAVEKRLIETR